MEHFGGKMTHFIYCGDFFTLQVLTYKLYVSTIVKVIGTQTIRVLTIWLAGMSRTMLQK